jgi:hypothetical protein
MRCGWPVTDWEIGFEIKADIDYIKRQQIKWFGHVIRQTELNITQRVINKKYENINRETKKISGRWNTWGFVKHNSWSGQQKN